MKNDSLLEMIVADMDRINGIHERLQAVKTEFDLALLGLVRKLKNVERLIEQYGPIESNEMPTELATIEESRHR